jgi:hypothetical protein
MDARADDSLPPDSESDGHPRDECDEFFVGGDAYTEMPFFMVTWWF